VKKLLFVLAMLLVIPAAANAQEYTVGAGASLDGEYPGSEDARASILAMGLDLPGFDSGVYAEASYDEGVQYSIWSSNLTKFGNFIMGAELKVYGDSGFDFNQRAVVGYEFASKWALTARILEDLEMSNLNLQITYRF